MGKKIKQMKTLIKLLLFTSICAFAQHKTVEVDYIVRREVYKNVVLEYDSKLSYNDSLSVFLFDHDSQRTPDIDENDESGSFVAIGKSRYSADYKDYTTYRAGSIFNSFTKQISKKNYLVQDTTPKFNWNITSEEKKIEGFNCNKATVDFRGRKYIAWFTTALPDSFGPWKFNGLPGLILEVYDTELLYSWQAKKIKTKEKELKIPKFNFKMVSMKECEKINNDDFEKRYEMAKIRENGKVTMTKGCLMESKFEWEEKQSK
jgi:GLPGLI family protein